MVQLSADAHIDGAVVEEKVLVTLCVRHPCLRQASQLVVDAGHGGVRVAEAGRVAALKELLLGQADGGDVLFSGGKVQAAVQLEEGNVVLLALVAEVLVEEDLKKKLLICLIEQKGVLFTLATFRRTSPELAFPTATSTAPATTSMANLMPKSLLTES